MRHLTYHISMLLAAAFLLTSCLSDDNDNTMDWNNTGIPSDDIAGENPNIGSPTTSIPNIQYTVENQGNNAVVRIDMTGIQDADTYNWLKLFGTAQDGQNIWVSVDDKPKGITVTNNADGDENTKTVADLVFLIDNSGSMSEESDAIARDIKSWAQELEASHLDILFGCVGYSQSGKINGAINLSDADDLSTYLDRSYGTKRTVGFSGNDANTLKDAAQQYSVVAECGGMALRYADANIKFRSNSNRIYVNFTDEPNQPNKKNEYSTEYFKLQNNWNTNQGTVHTVFSADTTFTETINSKEKPWRISWYTGGTIIKAPSNFANVTLDKLPVTGAMQNSYTIRFTNVRDVMDGKIHHVTITILSKDGNTRAEKTFDIVIGNA